MRIEEDYEPNENELNATNAMNACMSQIEHILIEPMMEMGMVTDEQQETLGMIAVALKVLKIKAQAYEDLTKGDLPQDWQN
jgi:hypothetical protein